ncbi:MAG: hypothetical protein K9W44_00445 [Candidatus Lokiarchaeota archaeon]|nr:hypothetical protein [Candidatus Harpocratesius repetitus]
MHKTTQSVNQILQFCSHYSIFNKISFFKKLVKWERKAIDLPVSRQAYKWELVDFLTILCYIWIQGFSVQHASEKSNRWEQKYLKYYNKKTQEKIQKQKRVLK